MSILSYWQYNMYEVAKTFLLAWDKFMAEIQLRQPDGLDKSRFTYSTYGPFSEISKQLKNLCKQEIIGVFIGPI